MRRQRVRQFAAPLVVVTLAPGCRKASQEERPPPGRVDAAVTRAALDAGAAAPRPDAPTAVAAVDAAPPAADHLVFYDGPSGSCLRYPDRAPADCSKEQTLVLAWKEVQRGGKTVKFNNAAMTCQDDTGDVECPPELLPNLTGGARLTRRHGDQCFWQDLRIACPGTLVFEDPTCYQIDDTGQRQWADCPEHVLPPAPSDRLIHQQGAFCFPVGASGGRGRVTCPPGGPTVAFAEIRDKELGAGKHVGFREWDLSCDTWVETRCSPDRTCNPPPPQPIECPEEMLPRLINGAKPTSQKDGKCFWESYQVSCK
jgi:hypothetical protein